MIVSSKKRGFQLKFAAVLTVLVTIAVCFIIFCVIQIGSKTASEIIQKENNMLFIDSDAPLSQGIVVIDKQPKAFALMKNSATGPRVSAKHIRNSSRGVLSFDTKKGHLPPRQPIRAIVPTLSPKLRQLFMPAINPSDHENYVNALRACVDLFKFANLTYFLYSGSLIGWYRHGGKRIPWDDDIDLALMPTIERYGRNITAYLEHIQRAANRDEFRDKYGRYAISEQDGVKLKCYSKSPVFSVAIKDFEWRWPFVDIHLMKVYSKSTRQNVFAIDSNIGDVVIEDPVDALIFYKKKWVFPLERGVFEGVHISLPHDVPSVLWNDYDLSMCVAKWYNHRLEGAIFAISQTPKVNCTDLTSFVKFTNMDEILRVKSEKGGLK